VRVAGALAALKQKMTVGNEWTCSRETLTPESKVSLDGQLVTEVSVLSTNKARTWCIVDPLGDAYQDTAVLGNRFGRSPGRPQRGGGRGRPRQATRR
jgi:hypothetical protein